MGIADRVVADWFRNVRPRLGLADGDHEISVPGYHRVTPDWDLADGARTKVVFGPFARVAEFDRVVVFDASGAVVDAFLLHGRAAIPDGMMFEYTARVEVDG